MRTLHETLDTPVLGHYQVIVCGGGVAGVAAAAAAARQGASVLLIEKSIHLGGLATIGLISWYEPLCDGRGRKLMHGMACELLRLSIDGGESTLPPEWRDDPERVRGDARYATFFSPTRFGMLLDRWVQEAGVRLLFDTVAVRPVMEGKTCAGVAVENKTGRGCYTCDCLVDATGDAELAHKAGVPCADGQNYMTYIGYLVSRETCRRAADSGAMLEARKWTSVGSDLWGRGHPEGYPLTAGTTAEEITRFVLDGRKLWLERLNAESPAADAASLPSMPQLRTVRRIEGDRLLTEADEGKFCETSVAVAGDFANRGKWYEIPFGTLYASPYRNILTAGRCISSAGWAWEVTRVIPAAVATGQAAGTAAALCAERGCDAGALPCEALRAALTDQGVRLHYEE